MIRLTRQILPVCAGTFAPQYNGPMCTLHSRRLKHSISCGAADFVVGSTPPSAGHHMMTISILRRERTQFAMRACCIVFTIIFSSNADESQGAFGAPFVPHRSKCALFYARGSPSGTTKGFKQMSDKLQRTSEAGGRKPYLTSFIGIPAVHRPAMGSVKQKKLRCKKNRALRHPDSP